MQLTTPTLGTSGCASWLPNPKMIWLHGFQFSCLFRKQRWFSAFGGYDRELSPAGRSCGEQRHVVGSIFGTRSPPLDLRRRNLCCPIRYISDRSQQLTNFTHSPTIFLAFVHTLGHRFDMG